MDMGFLFLVYESYGNPLGCLWDSYWIPMGNSIVFMCGSRWAPRAPLALISLFDGTGMARAAVGDLLEGRPDGPVLVQSVFVELDDALARRVEGYWEARARRTGCVPHRRIGADVWDLLRGPPPALEVFTQGLPQRCLVLVIAGSPCQQLTCAGWHADLQGCAARRRFSSSVFLSLLGPCSVFAQTSRCAWWLRTQRS